MKINLRKGQILFLTVRAPKSGEIFQIPLELGDENTSMMVPKTDGLAVGDVQTYSNWQTEQAKEQARLEILAAAQRLKDPNNPAHNKGYCNLLAIEYGVGSKNPAVAQARKEKGFV
jgi:hypothetical protein